MSNLDKISKILEEYPPKKYGREYITKLILTYLYPEFESLYFIDHISKGNNRDVIDDYEKVFEEICLSISESIYKNIIICQIEEPFLDINNKSVKNNISELEKKYNKKIKLVTNSVLDYHESKKIGLDTIYRSGILDLICYVDVNSNFTLDVRKINFHSAFVYQNYREERDEIFNIIAINNLENKFAFIKYPPFNIRIENTPLTVTNKYKNMHDGFFPDSPYESYLDLEWAEKIGFFTEIESFNKTDYAPTLSEKTFRALHLMRPALIFGGMNTRKRLQNLGFDTWDWLIDWRFDKEPNYRIRHDLFLEELQRLLALDLEYVKQLLDENKDKLIFNRNRVLELIENYANDNYFLKAIN